MIIIDHMWNIRYMEFIYLEFTYMKNYDIAHVSNIKDTELCLKELNTKNDDHR